MWDVFWYRGPDRPQPKDVKTRIEILHPGDEDGNGLVRHCYFPVPKWLLSGGVGQSWEWLTEVKPFESWRYDAVGKPLWSRATGWTRLEPIAATAAPACTFIEEYEAFNPIMRVLFEKRVHERLSRDNDTILAALEGGLRWHQKRRARIADASERRPLRLRHARAGSRCVVVDRPVRTALPRRVGSRLLVRHRARLPGAVFAPGDAVVHGWCCTLVGASLEALDEFEGAEYQRVAVRCTDGTDAVGYHWIAPVDGVKWLPDGTWGERRVT